MVSREHSGSFLTSSASSRFPEASRNLVLFATPLFRPEPALLDFWLRIRIFVFGTVDLLIEDKKAGTSRSTAEFYNALEQRGMQHVNRHGARYVIGLQLNEKETDYIE